MGNSSSASRIRGEDLLRESVQRLLEAPVWAVGGKEEQDEIWDDLFSCGLDEEAFYENISMAQVMEMRDLQPGNLKMLSRKALANISRFMESRRPGPGRPAVEVVLSSVRVLTRVLPAMYMDPVLHSWCWRERPMEYLLMYMADSDAGNVGAREEDSDDGRGGGDGVVEDDGGDAKAVEMWNGVDDFPVCFAAVTVHCITNLLCFPGFAIDEEATDWDDHYTPIPELHYGIREASIIWAPGVAVTEHNMREVIHFDSNRREVLRLLLAALSLPLFVDPPSAVLAKGAESNVAEIDQSLRDEEAPVPRPTSSTSIAGTSLSNPLATIATSRHLPFSTEIFYSLLNVAVLEGSSTDRGGSGEVGGAGVTSKPRPRGMRRVSTSAWRTFGFGGGGRGGVNDDKSQSLVEWCLQTLALLLRGGRPYKELIEARGVYLPVEGGVKFGSIPRHVEVSVECDPAYNCHRRCVFVIHSDDDLDCIAFGLLRILNDARLGRTRRPGSVQSVHQETLMVFATFVHENPRFVPRLAASEDLARGTAVCMCHLLEEAVNALIEREHVFASTDDENSETEQHRRSAAEDTAESDPEAGVGGITGALSSDRKPPHGSDVGLLVLVSRVLLTLSEDDKFMAALSDMPAGGRRGEFSAPEMEMEVGVHLLEVLLSLTAWSLTQGSGSVSVATPALAAVARNACPFLQGGMREQTAEWMLDALEVQLGTKTSTAGGGAEVDMGMEVGAGGASWPSSWDSPSTPVSMGVASLLLEGLAAGVAFHNDEQEELMVAMAKRSLPPQTGGGTKQHDEISHGSVGGGSGGAGDSRPGVLFSLAARGGLLNGGDDVGTSVFSSSVLASGEGWFKVSVACSPWEGWAIRKVIWPLVATLTDPERQKTCTSDARELMADAREYVLRPAGLCPPWDKDGDNEDDEDVDVERSHSVTLSRAAAAKANSNKEIEMAGAAADPVVGAAGGSVELARGRGVAASVAAKIRSSVVGGAGGGGAAAIIDPEVIESASKSSESSKRSGVAASGALSFTELRDKQNPGKRRAGGAGRRRKQMDWVSEGGDLVDGVPEVGGEGEGVGGAGGARGGVERLSCVVAVEEPWQSIYLWSLLFVKTTVDVALFDRRAVRLFEVSTFDDTSTTTGNTISSMVDEGSFYTDASNLGSSAFAGSTSDHSSSRTSPEDEYEQQTYTEQQHYSDVSGRASTTASSEEEKQPPARVGSNSPTKTVMDASLGAGGGVKGVAGEFDGVFEAGGGARAEELV